MSTASFIVPAGDPIDIDEYTDEYYGASLEAQERAIEFYASARLRAATEDSSSTSRDESSEVVIPTAPVVSTSTTEADSSDLPLIVLPPPPAAFEPTEAEHGTELAWQEDTGRASAITVDVVASDDRDPNIPEAYVAGSRPPLPSPVVAGGGGMRRNSRDQRTMREDGEAVNWKSASNPHREVPVAPRRNSGLRRSVSLEPTSSSPAAAVGSPSSAGSSSTSSKRGYRRAESGGSSATSDTFNQTSSGTSADTTSPHGDDSSNTKKSKGWGFGAVGRAQRSIQRGLQVEGGVREKLFGDAKPMEALLRTKRKSSRDVSGLLGNHPALLPRMPLPAYITHNPSTNLWIVTINTNQKALDAKKPVDKRSLKAVSVSSEAEANAIVEAFAPPRMHPFDANPSCYVCKNRFGMLNRPGHCRNCGVCICSNCCTFWPSRMIPDTYNIKNESTVRICISCDWLATSFRTALAEGNFDQAVALYESGNVNLRTVFANLKGDEYFPVHGAVFGGNVDILRWLVDEHHCPIRNQNAWNYRKNDKKKSDFSLATSHGRTLLQIAAQARNVDIMRYLVVDKEVSVDEIKEIRTALLSLESTLHRVAPTPASTTPGSPPRRHQTSTVTSPVSPVGVDVNFPSQILETTETENHLDRKVSALSSAGSLQSGSAEPSAPPPPPPPEVPREDDAEEVVATSQSEEKEEDGDLCIICFDKQIDCVAIPCGHQMCCLECTANLQECPVCSGSSTFIRIFRP